MEVFKEGSGITSSTFYLLALLLILIIFNIEEKIHTCKKDLIAGFLFFFFNYFTIL